MARKKLKSPQYFPHIPRNISRIILLLIFLFLASFLVEKGKTYGSIDEENINGIYEKLKERPNSEILHYKLGKALQNNGNYDEAARELLIAKELGVPEEIVNEALINIQDQKVTYMKITTELTKWKKIVEEKPDYRDGWYQLSVLQWRLSDVESAKESINKALELDPNYKPARDFYGFLRQVKEDVS